MTIRERYPCASCLQCGWVGYRTDMDGELGRPVDEFCPNCGSDDTEWLTQAEHDAALKDIEP